MKNNCFYYNGVVKKIDQAMTKIVVILPDTEWPRNFLFVIKGNLAYKDRHVKG